LLEKEIHPLSNQQKKSPHKKRLNHRRRKRAVSQQARGPSCAQTRGQERNNVSRRGKNHALSRARDPGLAAAKKRTTADQKMTRVGLDASFARQAEPPAQRRTELIAS